MKKKWFLFVLAPLLLVGCGGTTNSGGSNGGSTISDHQAIKYTVKFANTSMPDVQIEAGKSLAKPDDPTKNNCVFVGWYLDANFQSAVTFPLTIHEDTTIYANFYSYQDAFKKARNNTIGENVTGYEYDYTLNVSVSYTGLALNGNTIGNSKYNASSADISFYDEHENSGALFYDGSKYKIKKARELHEISLDENQIVKSYTIKEVGDDYRYDSSSFAKAVFEYSDDKLKSIEPTENANEYALNTSFNASAGIALVGNYINHPMVESIIGSLPETSVDTGMFVTFSDDKLNSYRYEMNIDVSGIKLDLTYKLMFKNVGVAPTITPKVFEGMYVSANDVAKVQNELNGYFTSFKALERSGYDFKAKTAVDYAKKNAINATVKGFTKRKVTNGSVYFLNDYEVDTDHKNADLYKASGLKDCHGARVKLANGEVHDLKKKLLGGYTDIKTISGYNEQSIDNYYLLDVLSMIGAPSFIQKITDDKNNKITYSLGSDTKSVAKILNAFNQALRLNPLGECSVDVKAFGSFADSSIIVKDFECAIVIENGALSSIELHTNGRLKASFPQSRDFSTAQEAGFKLDYTLQANDKADAYEPASTVNEVK